jgi:hypothetical protein
MDKAPDAIRSEIEETRAQMTDTIEAIGHRADITARAKESIGEKKESVVSAVVGARDAVFGTASAGASVVSSMLSDTVPHAAETKARMKTAVSVAQKNPLGLAFAGAARGFLAAMLIPSTRIETGRLGPVASQLKESAVEAGENAIEHGKEVAGETAQVALASAAESAISTRRRSPAP